MKKRIYFMAFILVFGLLAGCSGERTESKDVNTEDKLSQGEEQLNSESSGNNDIELNDRPEMGFTYDYSEDIKADVQCVVSGSASLQMELENIEKIIQKYTPLAELAQTQEEMNIASQRFFVIWDTELNHLWSRLSDSADRQTKEKLLAEQRNWIDMKEALLTTETES